VNNRLSFTSIKAHEYCDTELVLRAKVEMLARLIRHSKAYIAYTGAGISTAAGIDQGDHMLGHFTIPANAVSGEPIVAELKWSTGSRHLHMPVPYPAGTLRLNDLVAFPGTQGTFNLGVLPSVFSEPERGWGMEVELITGPPTGAEVQEGLEWSVEKHADQWKKMLCTVAARNKLVERCSEWEVTEDSAIVSSPASVAHRMIAATDWAECATKDELQQAFNVTIGVPGTLKTEYKSPAPPGELRYSRLAKNVLHACDNVTQASCAFFQLCSWRCSGSWSFYALCHV
jgi:hypothetical protein